MQLSGVLTVKDEVCGHDDGQVPIKATGGDELAEVELLQHRSPFVLMIRSVPG